MAPTPRPSLDKSREDTNLPSDCRRATLFARTTSVETNALVNRSLGDTEVGATVIDEGDRGGASDGLESDASGRIYSTNYEHNAILRRGSDWKWETIIHDPRLLWPDTLSLAANGYLYVTANQLHRQARYHNGQDLRQKPYTLFRIHIDAQPVLLRFHP